MEDESVAARDASLRPEDNIEMNMQELLQGLPGSEQHSFDQQLPAKPSTTHDSSALLKARAWC